MNAINESVKQFLLSRRWISERSTIVNIDEISKGNRSDMPGNFVSLEETNPIFTTYQQKTHINQNWYAITYFGPKYIANDLCRELQSNVIGLERLNELTIGSSIDIEENGLGVFRLVLTETTIAMTLAFKIHTK